MSASTKVEVSSELGGLAYIINTPRRRNDMPDGSYTRCGFVKHIHMLEHKNKRLKTRQAGTGFAVTMYQERHHNNHRSGSGNATLEC